MQLQYLPDVPQPVPVADLPEEYRIKNWIGRGAGGMSGGSCVHASTRMVFRVSGRYDLEEIWHQQNYEGPETDSGLLEKLDREGILFAATNDGDVGLLESASRTGRWAVIFYYPSHSIAFCGFDVVDGEEVAILLDNNFPKSYISISKQVFIDSWQRAYGGFAVVPWIEPTVPRTFARTIPRNLIQRRMQ